jgi:acetolactate synthase I/III small subunit
MAVTHHTLTVLVQNKAGVLARVAGLFARRGYNIYSLAVAPTEDERFSRITIVVDVESAPLEQMVKQLFKIVPVVKITELSPDDAVERELIMVSVRATGTARSEVIELTDVFEGRIVDVGHDTLTVMLAGIPTKLDDFEELVRAYEIVELQRTGRIALSKLEKQSPARLRALKGKAS